DLRPLFFDGLRPSQFSLVTTSPSQAALSRLPRQLLLQIALALSPGLHPKLDEIQGASPDPPPRRLDPSRVERGFGGLLHAGCTAPRMLAQVCRRRHRRYQGKEQAVTRGGRVTAGRGHANLKACGAQTPSSPPPRRASGPARSAGRAGLCARGPTAGERRGTGLGRAWRMRTEAFLKYSPTLLALRSHHPQALALIRGRRTGGSCSVPHLSWCDNFLSAGGSFGCARRLVLQETCSPTQVVGCARL
ncbi:unnamed protein product, partial [Prorocentrum cordatum]